MASQEGGEANDLVVGLVEEGHKDKGVVDQEETVDQEEAVVAQATLAKDLALVGKFAKSKSFFILLLEVAMRSAAFTSLSKDRCC